MPDKRNAQKFVLDSVIMTLVLVVMCFTTWICAYSLNKKTE